MKEIAVAGFKGNYFQATKNIKPQPLLFIHGAFCDHLCFNKIAPLFSGYGYNGYAFPRRGRAGHSPANAEGLFFDDYLQDTLTVIRHIQPTPILIGHSLGGLLAMKVTEEKPVTSAMVLLNSAPPAMLTAQAVALPYFLPLLPKILTGKPFKPSLTAFKTLALQMVDSNQNELAQSLIPESGIVYRQMMLGQIRLKQPISRVPALVVGSLKDRIVSSKLNKTTARKTNGELKQYADHGHWIIEEPGIEELVNDIVNWLEKI